MDKLLGRLWTWVPFMVKIKCLENDAIDEETNFCIDVAFTKKKISGQCSLQHS